LKCKVIYLCLQATRQGQASYAHVNEIIKGLRKRKWHVELFEPSYAKKDIMPGPLIRILEFLIVQAKLWSKIKKKDIIYIRFHIAAFPSALLSKLLNIPVIQELNGPYEDLFIAWGWTRNFAFIFKRLMRIQLKWADAIIVVTPQLKRWVLNEVGCNKVVFVVPNGANIELFIPNAICRYKLPKSYVVFFGALAPWQGIDTLVKSINCPSWPEELHLVIIGDGVKRSLVEETVKINKKIIYLGRLPYPKIPGIVAHSIAGLSPKNNLGSRSDTGLYPLKVFETLACGVPVIVTDFPGQADLVRKYRCGLVIPSDEPDALAEAVAYLYSNCSEREEMGKRGRKIIEREHSWDKRSADTEIVLSEVLRRNK